MREKAFVDTNTEYRIKFRFIILTILLVVFYTSLLFSATIYIDPTYTASNQNGSISNPYSSWNQVTFINGNTYLQKRGTVFNTTGGITITGRNNITIGAYDTGSRPTIVSSGSGYILDLTTVSNFIIKDLEIYSTGNATSSILIDGYGTAISANNLIENCDLHDCEWGVRIISQAPGNRILNCIIHNTGDDGIYAKDITDIEIGYCNIYNVNLKYFINPDQSYSAGDNIQLVSLYDLYFNIHHNTLDHSSTGNKFCFIVAGETYTGLIEHNTMIGNSGAVTSCLYFGHTSGTVVVRYNTLQDGNYGIYSYVNDLQLYYNKIARNNQGVTVMTNHNLTAKNNVFYNNVNASISSISNTSVTSINNIFYLSGGSARAYSCNNIIISNYNNFNIQQASFLNGHSTLASWQSASGNDMNSFIANPMFVNPIVDDFCIQSTSSCINSGSNVGLTTDFFGTSVPQASGPDIGIHEFIATTGNQPPTISNQIFSIAENTPNGTLVGQVIASDPDAGQTISYTITGGNSSNAFSLNSSTGALIVANTAAVNYESTTSFQLSVQVQDNGTGSLTASAIVTVNVTNVNEAPQMNGQTFSINENSANGTQVGTMTATDPDQGQTITYSIQSGNTNNAFAINASTGQIIVNNAVALDYESQPNFQLIIRAQDNGTPGLNTTATAQINITNLNENPVISNQSFAVPSNSPNGTMAGVVVATDPDNNQTLSYSITAGNTNTAFSINASTGTLTVANSSVINYITNPVFTLTVRVQDNGSPVLSSFATITVNITPTNNAPVIANQSFAINENSPQGTSVGQVIATDPDPGQTLTYSLISGNTGNTFLVSSSGLISVANAQMLNFENQSSYQLLIQVSDNGIPQLASSTNITITVNNVNEVPSVAANQAFTLAEHVPAGTVAGNVQASDPDNGQSLTYSIVAGNTNNSFVIAPSTGVLSVLGTVCFEACGEYNLTIRATDNGSPALYDEDVVHITLTDVNENPVINNQTFVVEGYTPAGTVVGTVEATDPDFNQSLSYYISSGNTNNAFGINGTTGTIIVTNSSALNYITNPVFELTIRVMDNGSPVLYSYGNITISVSMVNTAPTIVNQSFTINENSPQGLIVGIIAATDPDPGQNLSFVITSGNSSGAFLLGNNGILSIANASLINFEDNPQFQLSVTVSDNGQPQLSASALVNVVLNDINENPSFAGNTNLNINEHVAIGTTVGTVIATDPDAGQTLTYSFTNGNTNNAFSISTSTGEITVNNNICFENCSQYTLTIRATDNGSPVKWSETNSLIQLNDVNELPVVENQSFIASAFATNGTIVGTVIATDPDFNQDLTYTILSGNSDGAWGLDATTGDLYVLNSNSLNPLTNPMFSLIVKVEDNGNPILSANATITITLNTQNTAPEILSQTFTINENVPAGTVVGTILATDPDPGQTLNYIIVTGNMGDAFAISPNGILSVNNANAIDYESNTQFTLLVLVSDNGSPVLWSQAPITININNVNDAPVMLPQTYLAKENIPNGRYVCRVIGSDQDPGDTFQFYLMDGNTEDAFWMQAYTGRIFVNNSVALNFEVNPVFYLTVRVVDNHNAYSEQIITINLKDMNEAPVVENQSFTVNQTAPNGTEVGQVIASDPDQGQILRYFIMQGNQGGAFAIDMLSGMITVANSTALLNSNGSFVLTVRVRDNGSPGYSTNGYMTINVTRNKDTEEMTAEAGPDRLNLLMKVYPNPSSDGIFNIKLEEDTTEETSLVITDMTGKKVREEGFSGMLNRVDLSGLPAGVYLMHAQNAQKHTVSKLIKQ